MADEGGGEAEVPEPTVRVGFRRRGSMVDPRRFLRDNIGRVTDFYKKVGDLGEGAFGDVWLARQRIHPNTPNEHEGRLVAVKRVRKPSPDLDEEIADEAVLEELHTEVELMKALDHPSICRLLQVYEDVKNLYLVMEHINGGELLDRVSQLGCLTEYDAARVVQQVASALTYCHHHGVVHRDIKPENILVVDPSEDSSVHVLGRQDSEVCKTLSGGPQSEQLTVKVIDFGFGCRVLHGVQLRPKVGTFLYAAPEAIKGDPCDEKQDVWALGCVLYVLLSGNAPFFGPGVQRRILEGTYSMEGEPWDGLSPDAKDLISKLLVVDPAKRLSAADLHSHPWLQPEVEQTHGEWNRKKALPHVKNLQAFHGQSLFRHICTGVLARQLDESGLHKLHSAFSAIDEDENGILSLAEFKQVMRQLAEEDAAEGKNTFSNLPELFQEVDMDGSGHIDYTEFIAATIDRRIEEQESVCWSAFQVFDLNGDGTVSRDEIQQVLKSAKMQESLSEGVASELWEQLSGGDGSERIEFDAFLAALRGVQASKATENISKQAEKEKEKAPDSAAGLKLTGIAPRGLPLPMRVQKAAASMGLPIANRGRPTSVGDPQLPLQLPGRPFSTA